MKRRTQIKRETICTFDNNKHFYHPIFRKVIFSKTFRDNFILGHWMFYKNRFIKNFNFYSFFLKNLKKHQQFYFVKNKIKFYKNILFLSPFFFYKKQLFIKNIKFFNYLDKENMNGFFLFKNLMKVNQLFFLKKNLKFFLISYNYAISNILVDDLQKIENLQKQDEWENLFKIKFNTFNNYAELGDFNFFLNFDIFCFNAIEFYKILIYMFILDKYKI